MQKFLPYLLIISSFVFADDYSFDMDELEQIEVKTFEYNGYLKTEYKHQVLNQSSPKYLIKNKNNMEAYLGEAYLDSKYFKENYTFESEFMANYENIDNIEDNSYNINQAFINYKYNTNHQITLGKKIAKWGKGYFFNPIAFIDKKKDPNNPEDSKEGYIQTDYKYNKVLSGDLQNISLDAVYIKTSNEINDELYKGDSKIIALKTYLLYRDIDIDLAYLYSNKSSEKYGIDFSANLETNFEIHGEYGKFSDGYYSYLLGLKYLTINELTITSEYYYQSEEQLKTTPFWGKKYFINKFSQKEPFDILYLNIYYKNSLNIEDNSHQNNLGFIYTKFKNLDIDFSVNKYFGDNFSEYGSKLVDEFLWLQLKYSF